VGLPESLVRYVTRTLESVILDDASSLNGFSTDPYIVQHHTRSVLCLPLINQTKLTGVLYLEHNLASYVFTPERITVLKVLASQAAISLENRRLYLDLGDREAKIRRLVDANVLGIFFWNLEGAIVGANEAFLRLVQYSREDLVSGLVRWTELTSDEWRDRDKQAIADVIRTGIVQPFEKEYLRKDGARVPVLLGSAMFEGSRSEGVSFVLDLSEQKRAEGEISALKDELYRENLALRDAYREISELKEKLVQEKLIWNRKSAARWISSRLWETVQHSCACCNWSRPSDPAIQLFCYSVKQERVRS
jgi:PAS domain S-box-containing protein